VVAVRTLPGCRLLPCLGMIIIIIAGTCCSCDAQGNRACAAESQACRADAETHVRAPQRPCRCAMQPPCSAMVLIKMHDRTSKRQN